MQKQRLLVTEAKFLLKKKEHELAVLKQEMYHIEQFILKNEYVAVTRKNELTKKRLKKFKDSQYHKKTDMLKAAVGGVREN